MMFYTDTQVKNVVRRLKQHHTEGAAKPFEIVLSLIALTKAGRIR